jgi:hypothetical protein
MGKVKNVVKISEAMVAYAFSVFTPTILHIKAQAFNARIF